MLHFMCSLITPLVPVDGVTIWTPEQVVKYTARQKKYLELNEVGCVNKAPFASCGAVSSGIAFVHTHALPLDHFMVEKKEMLEPTLLTTEVMVDEDGKHVETAKMTHRLHEHITNQKVFKPIQVNVFDFTEHTKDEYRELTGQDKYRAHPAAAEIVANAGGHEAIKEILRNPLVGDVVFVGGAAWEEFLVILKEMPELSIIKFGHSTARLAFPKLGMHAFSWSKPEMATFGVIYCKATNVWRNFMCAHGYGTLNGYTPTSQGEPGIATNMRILVRLGDWLRFMHMRPISKTFRETAIWELHSEEMESLGVAEENKMGVCFDEGVKYISRSLLITSKGGKKGSKALAKKSATGEFRGTTMNNSKTCDNRLQELGKEMAEKMRGAPATDPKFKNRLHEITSKNGEMSRTTDYVRVRVSRLTRRKEIEVIAVLSGSLKENESTHQSSVTVMIQPIGKNKISYPEMRFKFDEEKKKYKSAATLPVSTLKLVSTPGMSLEAVKSSLETCSSDKPVKFFRATKSKGSSSSSSRLLEPNEVAEWTFEVIEFQSADEKIAEMT